MHKGRRLSYFTSHHGVINCQRDYCATSYSCKTCSNVGAVDIFGQNFALYFSDSWRRVCGQNENACSSLPIWFSSEKNLFIEVTLHLIVFHLLSILAFFYNCCFTFIGVSVLQHWEIPYNCWKYYPVWRAFSDRQSPNGFFLHKSRQWIFFGVLRNKTGVVGQLFNARSPSSLSSS